MFDNVTYEINPFLDGGVAGGLGCGHSFDVYLGTDEANLELVCTGVVDTFCDVTPLETDTSYFWQVVTKVPGLADTVGPVWSFATVSNCSFDGSDPGACTVDSAQTSEPGSGDAQGVQSVTLSFGCSTIGDSPADFDVTVEVGTPPAIDAVQSDGSTATLTLSDPIPAGQWTCFALTGGNPVSCLGYLPGDANLDGTTDGDDLSALTEALSEGDPVAQGDLDRDGVVGPEDILRAMDLLNGGGDYDVWFGATLGDCPLNE